LLDVTLLLKTSWLPLASEEDRISKAEIIAQKSYVYDSTWHLAQRARLLEVNFDMLYTSRK